MPRLILKRWTELPEPVGAVLWDLQQRELEKGAQHKYIRRLPNKSPPPKWRYFYDVGGGKGLGHEDEMIAGAKFLIEGGHFEVLETSAQSVKIKHDETGEIKVMKKRDFQNLLHDHHGERIKERTETLRKLVAGAELHGSEKQKARLRERAEAWSEVFGGMWGLLPGDPLPEIPKAASQAYKNRHSLMTDLIDYQRLVSILVPGPMDSLPEKVPPNLQRVADRLVDQLAETYDLDPVYEDPKELLEANKAWHKRAEYVVGEKAANAHADVRAVFIAVRDMANGEWPKRYNSDKADPWKVRSSGDINTLTNVLDFDQAREDLKLDARMNDVTPEASVWVAETLGAAKRSYYSKGVGSRTGYTLVRKLIGQVRTHRGLDAVTRLLGGSYHKGKAIASKSAREVLGYGALGESEKRARRTMQDLRRNGWDKAKFEAARTPPDLALAIKSDAKRAGEIPDQLVGLYGRDTNKPKILKAEREGGLLHHRWSQLPERESEVKKLFESRFGVRLVLEDHAFDEFTDPEVKKKEEGYGWGQTVDISSLRWSDTKDVLAKVDPGDRNRAKRLLNLERHNWGLDSFRGDLDPNVRGDVKKVKAAANELKEAVVRSHETRVEAATAVFNAFSDFEEATGTRLDLSALPVVVADQNISALASAHYAPAMGPGGLDKERLKGADLSDPKSFSKSGGHVSHIAIGTRFEKSLAHEISHYLDNRVTLRHSDTSSALQKVYGELTRTERLNAMTEAEFDVQSTAISALSRMRYDAKGGDYLSCAVAWMVQQKANPKGLAGVEGGWDHPIAKEWFDRTEQALRGVPGGQEMYGLMEALHETGVMDRCLEKDKKRPDPLALIVEDLGGHKLSDEKKSYFSNGTEMLSRAVEQMIHHRLADKGKINPTLTELSYDDKPTTWDGPSPYADPKVFKEKIQPHVEKVFKFMTDNMTKGGRLVIGAELCKAKKPKVAPGQLSLFGPPKAKPKDEGLVTVRAGKPERPGEKIPPRPQGAPKPPAKAKPKAKPKAAKPAKARRGGGGGGGRGTGRGKARPGETREWKDGTYQKQADGKWKKIRDKGTKAHGTGEAAGTGTKDPGGAGEGVLGDATGGPGLVGRAHEAAGRKAPEGAHEHTEAAAVLKLDPPTPAVPGLELPDGREVEIQPPSDNSPAISLHPDLWPQMDELPELPNHVVNFPTPAALRDSTGAVTGHIERLYSHQAEGVQRVLYGWQKGDGVVLQDDAGLGKTNIALGALVANGGKRNLIVVPVAGKEGLKAQWIGERAAGLYDVDVKGAATRTTRTGREVVDFKPDEISPTEDGTYIVSYDELWETRRDADGKVMRDAKGKPIKQLRKSIFDGKWDAVAFDESHTMQKQGGMYSNGGKSLQKIAKKCLYMSATPYTNVSDMHYLTKLGLFGDGDEEFAKWALLAGARVEGNSVKNPTSHLPMAAIAATLHVHGKSVKRSTSLEGVTSNFDLASREGLTDEQAKAFKVADKVIALASEAVNPTILRGLYIGWNRQYWETCKVDRAVELGKKAIADGKQVAFFTSYKAANHNHLRAIPRMLEKRAAKMSMSDSPHVQRRAEELAQLAEEIRAVIHDEMPEGRSAVHTLVEAFGGGDQVAEIHGDTNKKPHAEQESYQAGKKRVCVATMARGGTGISLHDTTGESPRVQINLSLPWSGREFNQVAGRSHRLGSKSNTEMVWMIGEDDHEQHNGAVVAKRLQSMGSLTTGDPEITVDAAHLLNWEFAANAPDSDDVDALADALIGMEDDAEAAAAVAGEAAAADDLDDLGDDLEWEAPPVNVAGGKEDRMRGAADSEHAQAARDYFREFAERVKGGANVLQERFEEAQKRHKQEGFRRSRRAAEQLRQHKGWTVHWRSYAGAWEVDAHGLDKNETGAIKKKKVGGGKGKTYGSTDTATFHVPPEGMENLAKELGVSDHKVELSGQERLDPTKRSEVEQAIDALADKDLRVRFWGHSYSGQPVYLLTGRTFHQKSALSCLGRMHYPQRRSPESKEDKRKRKADTGWLIAEDHLQAAVHNLENMGEWHKMKKHPERHWRDRPEAYHGAERGHSQRSHLAPIKKSRRQRRGPRLVIRRQAEARPW